MNQTASARWVAALGLAGGVWGLAVLPAAAADVPAYGAADFVPTPAAPIGSRADGNG